MTDAVANIPCPKCRKSFAVPLTEISPNCATVINFGGQDAAKVQHALDQLASQLGNASIKISVKTKARNPWWKFWG
jgi:hypothetical protein